MNSTLTFHLQISEYVESNSVSFDMLHEFIQKWSDAEEVNEAVRHHVGP